MASNSNGPGCLAILVHTTLVILTGGLWGIVLLVRYLLK